MSKKIIIDGINVSECEFYEEMRELPDNLNGGYYIQHCYCGLQGDNYCICNKNPDCYFKQLQRLQAENEELKKEIKENLHYLACMTEQRNKLKQALEEIREILCEGRTFYEGYFEDEHLSRTDKAIKVINEVLK